MKIFSSASGPRRDETAGSLRETLRPAGAWLFGKIPAHGDFISRGIDHATHVLLDDWLSTEVAAGRAGGVELEDPRIVKGVGEVHLPETVHRHVRDVPELASIVEGTGQGARRVKDLHAVRSRGRDVEDVKPIGAIQGDGSRKRETSGARAEGTKLGHEPSGAVEYLHAVVGELSGVHHVNESAGVHGHARWPRELSVPQLERARPVRVDAALPGGEETFAAEARDEVPRSVELLDASLHEVGDVDVSVFPDRQIV